MQITHDVKGDVMYIKFNEKPFHRNKVMSNGLVVIDLAEDGTVIGIELISPSTYLDDPHEIVYRQAGIPESASSRD